MLSTDRSCREQLCTFANKYVCEVLGSSQNLQHMMEERKDELVEGLQQALLFLIEAIEDERISMETIASFAQRYAEHWIIYVHDAERLIRDSTELRNRFRHEIIYPFFQEKKQERAIEITNLFVDEFTIRLFREKQWELERMEVEKFNAIGNMAAGMAHELRNPITSIKGFLQLIYEMHPHPEQIRSYYNIIEDEVKRLDYILDRFLSLSRRKNLSMMRKFEEVNIGAVLEKSISLFEFEFIRLGIEPIISLTPDAIMLGNSKELDQTFINILKNACEEFQQIPDQKEKILKITCKFADEKISIIFFNNGNPIEHKDLKKIFSPFYSTKENGTGLGLAICKQIIEAHGGKINIYPEQNGTVVEVKLPKHMKERSAI